MFGVINIIMGDDVDAVVKFEGSVTGEVGFHEDMGIDVVGDFVQSVPSINSVLHLEEWISYGYAISTGRISEPISWAISEAITGPGSQWLAPCRKPPGATMMGSSPVPKGFVNHYDL